MYLFGGNGHCKVIIDIINKNDQLTIEGVFDDSPSCDFILGTPVFKVTENTNFEKKKLLISIGNNKIRKKIVSRYKADYLTLIHPNAVIGIDCNLRKGTVVMAGAIINSSVSIGKHCIINSGAIIEHDCFLKDFVHISPNASLAGNVVVDEGAHVGIGASVIQGIKIGKWSIVGAGAVIIKDVPDYSVVIGNPGKILRYNLDNE